MLGGFCTLLTKAQNDPKTLNQLHGNNNQPLKIFFAVTEITHVHGKGGRWTSTMYMEEVKMFRKALLGYYFAPSLFD